MYLRWTGKVSTRAMPLLLMSCRCSPGAEEGKGHYKQSGGNKDSEPCAYDRAETGDVWVARTLWWIWHKVSLRSAGVRWRWEVESMELG